ncbi:MAG: ribulokinase, partial [bacterium]
MEPLTIGLDFGTESARGVLVRCSDGAVVATATFAYPHGVLDRTLPGTGVELPPDWALQHPQDWLEALEALLRQLATPDVV